MIGPRRLALTGAAAIALALGLGASASAAPVFTYTPGAIGLNGSPVTADSATLTDYATIVLTPTATGATFTEHGTLNISAFTLGTNAVSASGLDSTYALYYTFSGAGTQNTPTIQPGTSGTFTSLNFSFFGAPVTGPLSFSPAGGPPSGIGTSTLLATGSLINGGVQGDALGQPAANATITFSPTAAASGFFTSPVPFYNMAFAGFQNEPNQVSTVGNTVTITGGGGSATYIPTSVPEPASIVVFSAALGGLALLFRRKRNSSV